MQNPRIKWHFVLYAFFLFFSLPPVHVLAALHQHLYSPPRSVQLKIETCWPKNKAPVYKFCIWHQLKNYPHKHAASKLSLVLSADSCSPPGSSLGKCSYAEGAGQPQQSSRAAAGEPNQPTAGMCPHKCEHTFIISCSELCFRHEPVSTHPKNTCPHVTQHPMVTLIRRAQPANLVINPLITGQMSCQSLHWWDQQSAEVF